MNYVTNNFKIGVQVLTKHYAAIVFEAMMAQSAVYSDISPMDVRSNLIAMSLRFR